jgi:hypothetical protein
MISEREKQALLTYDKAINLLAMTSLMNKTQWENFSKHTEFLSCCEQPGFGSNNEDKSDFYDKLHRLLASYTENKQAAPGKYTPCERTYEATYLLKRLVLGVEIADEKTFRILNNLFDKEANKCSTNDAVCLNNLKTIINDYWQKQL